MPQGDQRGGQEEVRTSPSPKRSARADTPLPWPAYERSQCRSGYSWARWANSVMPSDSPSQLQRAAYSVCSGELRSRRSSAASSGELRCGGGALPVGGVGVDLAQAPFGGAFQLFGLRRIVGFGIVGHRGAPGPGARIVARGAGCIGAEPRVVVQQQRSAAGAAGRARSALLPARFPPGRSGREGVAGADRRGRHAWDARNQMPVGGRFTHPRQVSNRVPEQARQGATVPLSGADAPMVRMTRRLGVRQMGRAAPAQGWSGPRLSARSAPAVAPVCT